MALVPWEVGSLWVGGHEVITSGRVLRNVAEANVTGDLTVGNRLLIGTPTPGNAGPGGIRVAGVSEFLQNVTISGFTGLTASRVATQLASSSWTTGQTVNLGPALSLRLYLVAVVSEATTNSGTTGLYVVGRIGSQNRVHELAAASGVSVQINAADEIEVTNTAGANRTLWTSKVCIA